MQRSTFLWQLAFGIGLFVAWHACGLVIGVAWISSPALVARKLADWFTTGAIYVHVMTTLTEMVVGLIIGVVLGALCGLLLGMSRLVATVVRPIIFAIYSVPLISLAPLLIMIFGIDMLPKIVLVATVVFFLVLFNTMKGVEMVDPDMVDVLKVMGSQWHESFWKVLLPGCMVWILSGVKVALPYALVAATVGEMMAARRGLGMLLSDAGQKFDVTAIYAILLILTVLGLLVAETGTWVEGSLLRWRRTHASGLEP
jgi:NitT/TauT family transport system permease protein